MLSRITVPLLATAVLVFACGPRSHTSAVAARPGVTADSSVRADVHVEPGKSPRNVNFVIKVTNGSAKRVELMFPSGRTHDFVVLDATGREVWRWSDGRMFTQLIQNRLIESRDVVTWNERWAAPPGSGSYTLVAVLHSSTFPVEQRVQFTIP